MVTPSVISLELKMMFGFIRVSGSLNTLKKFTLMLSTVQITEN